MKLWKIALVSLSIVASSAAFAVEHTTPVQQPLQPLTNPPVQQQVLSTASEQDQVRQTIDESIQALAQGNVTTFMTYWATGTDIAVVDPIGQKILSGPDAISQYLTAIIQQRRPSALSIENLNVVITHDGNFAWASGQTLSQFKQGNEVVRSMRRWVIFRMIKQNGLWKITVAFTPFG
jgi:ketosteroid isomerase-like protein